MLQLPPLRTSAFPPLPTPRPAHGQWQQLRIKPAGQSSGRGSGEGTALSSALSSRTGPDRLPWPYLDPCLDPTLDARLDPCLDPRLDPRLDPPPTLAMALPPLSWLLRLAAICHLTMLLAGEWGGSGHEQGRGAPSLTSTPQA